MYLRFVRLRVREGSDAALVAFYRDRVLPALETTPGCLYAVLLSPWRGEDYQSLTIWRSAADAEAYEDRGLYQRLLREIEPLLARSIEWRLRLASDAPADAAHQRREIPPDGYEIDAGAPSPGLAASGRLFVRVVTLRVAPDRLPEFVAIYRDAVLPALRAREGCCGALLAERPVEPGVIVSISFWDREEDAVRYEMSGEFDRLTERLKETFSPIYTWSVGLGEGGDRRMQAPRVSSYEVVQGTRLGAG